MLTTPGAAPPPRETSAFATKMKWITPVLLILTLVSSATAKDIDEDAILEVLRNIETDQTLPNGTTKKIKLVAELFDKPFRTDFRIVTPKELKTIRYEKEYTIYGKQKTLRNIDHELVVVTHDTGFIGGFIAYLEKKSHQVVLVQIAPEG